MTIIWVSFLIISHYFLPNFKAGFFLHNSSFWEVYQSTYVPFSMPGNPSKTSSILGLSNIAATDFLMKRSTLFAAFSRPESHSAFASSSLILYGVFVPSKTDFINR